VSPRQLRFVAFRVGPETFLIDIMAVRQIVPYEGSMPIPTAPQFIEGVVVLHDEAVPIIDLATRVHPARRESAEQPLVLLTHTPAGVVGLKVDEVRKMLTLEADQLLPAPALIRGVRGEFLVAIAQHDDEVLLVLDVDAVLNPEEREQVELMRRG